MRANEAALSEAAPDGIELLGIYTSIVSSEKHSGTFKAVWRMDSYGAMDRHASAARDDKEYARLLEEYGGHRDVRLGAHDSTEILKAVADTTIWSDPSEK